MQLKRTVIIGGGFGGLLTALKLSKEIGRMKDAPEIVLVDARDYHTYTPWLYGVATSQLASVASDVEDDIECSTALSFERIIRLNKVNIRFRKGCVEKVDHKEKAIVFDDGQTLNYSQIVLAYGSVVNDFGVEGVNEYAHVIQNVRGAFAVRNQVSELLSEAKVSKTVTVIGSGAVGVETAGEIAHFLNIANKKHPAEHKVRVLSASSEVASRDKLFIRQHAQKRLERLGVKFSFECMVSRIKQHSIEYTKDGEKYHERSDFIIWAGGLKPNPWVKFTGIKQPANKRFAVPSTLRIKKGVFAIGDITSLKQGDKQLPSAAWVAVGQAETVASNILAELKGMPLKEYRAPKKWPSVLLVGGKYGVATVYGVNLAGLSGYILRSVVDLHYFISILPLRNALIHWWKGSRTLSKDHA